MAALSPAVSNHSADTSTTTAAAVSSTTPLTTNASKNLRGLNKPKCIKCGNVARSRCPFQSCKSCCAKAQNPCHIHVLKGSSNIPEKLPSSGSPKVDQQSSDVSHSGSSHRVASLRQLSSSFAQFNNLRPVRSRKPLTRKDAQVLNEWRFLKLKEFKDREIEAENEAFDRYVRNVSLLEEVFSVNTKMDEEMDDEASTTNSIQASVDDNMDAMIAGLKTKLRSNPVRIENIRMRIQYIVGQGLRKLRSFELNDGASDLGDPDDLGNRPKKLKSQRAERASALSDLIDKLNKARNEEDIKACLEIHAQLLSQHNMTSQVKSDDIEESNKQIVIDGLSPEQQSLYSPPKWFSTSSIDQESLCRIDAQFSSLEEIEDL